MEATLVRERGPGLLLRLVYFVFVGLWLSGLWAAVAWIACVTIIGLPLGTWMLNRLPEVATLKPVRGDLAVLPDGRVTSLPSDELPLLVRAAWFVLVGWWASALWLKLAWLACATWIGLPVGFWMLGRVPYLVTLSRR